MDTNGAILGGRGHNGPSNLTPVMAAKLTVRAIRQGWTQEQRQSLIDEFFTIATSGAYPVRDKAAAARVLATLERNEIMSERNQVLEQGQELGAATDRLRATLGSPEARQALAALSAASQGTANPPVPPAQAPAPETPNPPETQPFPVAQGDGWASAGGAD